MKKYILAIDEGTTSTRAIVFDKEGKFVASAQEEFAQYFPRPGWVEHDAEEIYEKVLRTVYGATIAKGISLAEIAAVGVTNQRETTVVWDKKSGKPIYRAIVWQSRQTAKIADKLEKDGYKKTIHRKTGLLINPYFSATKIKWILDNVKGAKKKAKKGDLLFGTIDTWLIWKLTGGKTHATDYTNASRTMLFNINTLKWDDDILRLLDIPRAMLPEAKECAADYGDAVFSFAPATPVKIAGVAGDQQAALFGQCAFEKGEAKNTYGTGCFLLLNTGETPVYSKNGLLTTIALGYRGKVSYALEGSVFIGGGVIQFLRDGLKMVEKSSDATNISQEIKSTDGVYFVPALTGLGSPYWDNDARGAIFGMTRGTMRAHIVRAAVEAIAFQSREVFDVMQKEARVTMKRLNVDGGATKNDFLMQFQADIGDIAIDVPENVETTALGAAYLAGLAVGFYKDLAAIKQMRVIARTYLPSRTTENVRRIYRGWKKAVAATRAFKM